MVKNSKKSNGPLIYLNSKILLNLQFLDVKKIAFLQWKNVKQNSLCDTSHLIFCRNKSVRRMVY